MELEPASHWENELVRLAPLTEKDVSDEYIGWLNDPEINQFLESRFTRHDRSSVLAYVNHMVQSPNSLFLAIHSKSLGCHVGNIKLAPIDRHHGLGEIGLMIGARSAWGKGMASNAIGLICSIGFQDLKLRKLTAGCYASNKGSQIAFERAGFVVEAVRTDHFVCDGELQDLVLLARFASATYGENAVTN